MRLVLDIMYATSPAKKSVEVIRDAKKSGVDVTCETAPHYLVFDTDYLNAFINRWPELGGRFKMNPSD